MTDENPENATGDDAQSGATIVMNIPVELDAPRSMMFREITEQMDESDLRDIMATNLSGPANSLITQVYDNREQMAAAMEAEGDAAAMMAEKEDADE